MQHFQEKYTLLEEIKKINNLLIDTDEVALNEDNPTVAAVATKHGEGLAIKCFFNEVTVNLNSMLQFLSKSNGGSLCSNLNVFLFLKILSFPLLTLSSSCSQ